MTLPGSEKYRLIAPTRKSTWEQSVIEKSNREIRIEDVLKKYYNIQVPYDAASWKVRCPWAMEHEDGGLDKQFRIYSETNSGYCFAMHGRVDNINLYLMSHPPAPKFEAAKDLLDEFGVDYRKKSYQEIFNNIKNDTQVKFSYQDIVDAMKFYLSSFDIYDAVQYNDDVVSVVNEFNQQAKVVCSQAKTIEEVQQWYSQEKEKIKHYLLSLNG